MFSSEREQWAVKRQSADQVITTTVETVIPATRQAPLRKQDAAFRRRCHRFNVANFPDFDAFLSG